MELLPFIITYITVAGFTEHDTFRSNQIREGEISRTEALKLVEENTLRYESLAQYFDLIGIDFETTVNKINSIPKLWYQNPLGIKSIFYSSLLEALDLYLLLFMTIIYINILVFFLMKVALLSDIHANHKALEIVLEDLNKEEVDLIIVAGDIVGYYYWPHKVIDLIMSDARFHCIQGNHDRMLEKALYDKKFLIKYRRKYGTAYDICKEKLKINT